MSLYKWMLTYFSQPFLFPQVDSASQPAVETAISLYIEKRKNNKKNYFCNVCCWMLSFLFNYTVCLVAYVSYNSK